MQFEKQLCTILRNDPLRMDALREVRQLGLPDSWIGAGFVRDAVWDQLHGYPASAPVGDVDVVWFDLGRAVPAIDRALEQTLKGVHGDLDWSVKNQARMHERNTDAPYASVADAMSNWPETATAVAVRLSQSGELEVNAPLGIADLFELRITPTPRFQTVKRPIYEARITEKQWLTRYPRLTETAY